MVPEAPHRGIGRQGVAADDGRWKMGRKKGERKTVMVRIYERFAEQVKQAAGERGMTAADYCEVFLTPCVDKAHRDYIKAESKKLAGKGEDE
jgi:hypothetical protein